jgi:hypothetical protein
VKGVLRKLEDEFSADIMVIYVNDHNIITREFTLSSECLYTGNILVELCKNKILVSPKLEGAVCEHLRYGYGQCVLNDCIAYQNHTLGWYEIDGVDRYLYDTTKIGERYYYTDRKNIRFQSGSRETFLELIKNTVLPSTELTLALTIGYGAVVASRLRDEKDVDTIVVNFCGTSSKGKSTAEVLLSSPFMNPDIRGGSKTLCASHLATENALYAKLEGIHGVPIIIDDITTNSKIDFSDFIYALAKGGAKERCNGDGTLRNTSNGWSGVVVLSSESPILACTSKHQGLKVRCIHTDGIVWTKSAEEAENIKQILLKNYGFSGKEFAEYVSTIPLDVLRQRLIKSCDVVKSMMIKKDEFSSRIATKIAVFHLTAELLNEAFQYGISANAVIARLIKCEQDSFEERNNALLALDHMVDFIVQNKAHFNIETVYTEGIQCQCETYATGQIYGKIYKFGSCWKVHVLTEKTNEILKRNGLDNLKWIRKEWVDRGITEGDSDHNTKQKSYAGKKARYDCFTFPGGIQEPYSEPETPPTISNIPQETPVSDYHIDDSEQIDAIFGGANGTKD